MKHVVTDIREHFGHYLALMVILAFGVGALVFFQRVPQIQVISLFLTAAFYVLWGIIHHYLEGDLHIRIVLEYIAISLLGFLILWSIINRV